MPAALGRAIQKTLAENVEYASDGDEYAIIYDTDRAGQDADKRATLWLAQQPSITITTTLVMGLRRMRAKLRRRIEAWKALATASAQPRPHDDDSATKSLEVPPQPSLPIPTTWRSSFESSFGRWAGTQGADTIRDLRWPIAP